MLEGIRSIKSEKKDLRSFGLVIGIFVMVIAIFLLLKNNESYKTYTYISGVFIGLGIFLPKVLKPLYLIWMMFALVLGWVMTRLILSLLFFIVISFVRLIAGIVGKNFLEIRRTKNSDSFWNLRGSEIELNQDYEKQF